MSADTLAALEAHLVAIEGISFDSPDTDERLPSTPDLATAELSAEDLERARVLLARLKAAEVRVKGMQTRVLGELAGSRRPRYDAARRAPRVLDTSA